MTDQKAPTGNVPWIITFQRKDLLAAAWGSKKGADLLYHLLHRASWERKNKGLPETMKVIKFQENTPKVLEKTHLSLGTLHTYLKHFVSVGYISKEAYQDEYTIHTDVILAAFTNPPEKPGSETCERGQASEKSFKMKDCKFITLPREEYESLLSLKDECFNLKEMFQSLKHDYAQTLAELKEMFQSLKQNPSIDENAQASVEANQNLQSNDLRFSKSDDLENLFGEGESTGDQPSQSETEEKTDSSPQQPESETLFPEIDPPQKPTKPSGDKPLTTKPDAPTFTPPSAKSIAKERANRKRDILSLMDKAAGVRVPRVYADKPLDELITATIEGAYVDEDIEFSVKDIKGRGKDLTITNIANNMANAVLRRKSGEQAGKIVSIEQAKKPPQSELTDFTHWTDNDWDNWQRYGVKPDHARRA